MAKHKYKVTLKNGVVAFAEQEFLDLYTIKSTLNEHQPFVTIGSNVFAKEAIAMIQKVEEEKLETAEKENEHE